MTPIPWKRFVDVTKHSPEQGYRMPSGTFRFPNAEEMEALLLLPHREEYLDLLRASALLNGTPQALAAVLAEGFPSPGGLTWEEACALPWLEVPVPLLVTEGKSHRGGLAYMLLALLPEEEKCNRIEYGSLSQDARKAMKNALNLVSKKTGRSFAAMPRHASQKFSGSSLGLPLWLGAQVLAGRSDGNMAEGFSHVLATGALDEEGRLLPVDGVPEKADVLKYVCADRFLYPASSLDRVPPNGFPLHDAQDALFLLGDVEERFWRLVNPFRYDPEFFWHMLPAIRVWKHKSHMHLALQFAEECGCLQSPPADGSDMLGSLCDFLEARELDLGKERKKLLRLFDLEWAQKQARTVDLFRLCQLQLTTVNRDGVESKQWEDLSEACRAAVQSDGHHVSSLFLSYYARCCESLHNQFFFTPAPELKKHIEEELSRFTGYREHAVGEVCGMLCQGAAFCGDHKRALALANRSEKNFGMDKNGRLHALRREADRAYIFWDSGPGSLAERHEKACFHARSYIEKSEDCKENHPFAEALKARMRAEARLRLGEAPSEDFVKEARNAPSKKR